MFSNYSNFLTRNSLKNTTRKILILISVDHCVNWWWDISGRSHHILNLQMSSSQWHGINSFGTKVVVPVIFTRQHESFWDWLWFRQQLPSCQGWGSWLISGYHCCQTSCCHNLLWIPDCINTPKVWWDFVRSTIVILSNQQKCICNQW